MEATSRSRPGTSTRGGITSPVTRPPRARDTRPTTTRLSRTPPRPPPPRRADPRPAPPPLAQPRRLLHPRSQDLCRLDAALVRNIPAGPVDRLEGHERADPGDWLNGKGRYPLVHRLHRRLRSGD